MSFDEEWAQHKGDAARGSMSMQLNQMPGERGSSRDDPGGGKGDLVVKDDALGALGKIAYDLRQRLSVDGDHARQITFDASIELFNDGLEMGSALTELHDAWGTQLGTLKEALAHISNHLDYTRASHGKDDDKIATEMRNLKGQRMTVSRVNDYIK